ncbi:MAG: hypothetical protein KC731_38770 [Myxococcales bacterium]|nr:hypothetical protein [Myxococcales bacterium]
MHVTIPSTPLPLHPAKGRRLAWALALLFVACGDEGYSREEAEESCGRFVGTVAEPGCDESLFDACVSCFEECGDRCRSELALRPCLGDNFFCPP